MMTPMTLRRTIAALAVASAALLTACSSTPVVDEGELEDKISEQLAEEVGTAPDDIDCPEDLTGEVGETMTCTLTAGEDVLDLTVEVTEVDGTEVNYEVEVGEMTDDSGS